MAIRRNYQRAGLATYTRWTVAADDRDLDTSELQQALDAVTPMGRLKALKRAAAPLSDARLTVELEEIDERLKASHGNADLADLNALLALERGVALLQTARYLDSIVQVGRRNAAARERGKRSAKLPDEMQLRRQIELGRQAGRGSEQEVKKELADRYGVSLAAVNKRLRKPNGSPEETE